MAEITVNDFSEFKSALEGTQYDIIHLGNDIEFTSAGVLIPRNKSSILVNGHGFKITDYNSLAVSNMIRYPNQAGDPINFTLQNTIWSGHNYFGVVYAYPNDNFSNFTLILDHVVYTGPQAVYNRTGLTYFIDSAFYIERNGSASGPEELGEVNRVVIQGDVTVKTQATGTSVLWFLNPSGSLIVDENAVFTVSAPETYMFYTDGTPPPSMLFKTGSVTNIRTEGGLFYAAGSTVHIASSFILEGDASFTSTQSARRAVPSFKCRDTFKAGAGSLLFISAEAGGTSPLMYFGTRATLEFNDPKSVVLYNNGGNVFQFGAGSTAAPNSIGIDTELLNMWTTAGTGDFDDVPVRALAKKDGSNVTALINTNTTATTAITSNIADEDKGFPMTAATFNVMQAKVLSMGRLPVRLDNVTDISSAITGVTEALAGLRASYDATALSGSADASGTINLPVPSAIAVGTVITFGANWKFLTKYIHTVSLGSVSITHLTDLVFVPSCIPCKKRIIKRRVTDWYIEITDTREEGNDWLLYAWVNTPLAYDSYTLDNALILNPDSASEIIMSPAPVLVRRASWTQQGAVTRITWPELEGFLLSLNPDFLYHSGKYTTRMNWEVRVE